MAPNEGAASISVTVRVRPFTVREAAQLARCEDPVMFLGEGSLAATSTPKLAQKGLRSVIKVIDDKCLVFDPPEDNPLQRFSKSVVPGKKKVKDQTFMFDRVFDENATQQDVYEATTRGLLDNVLDGYNATIFAYGATGCGKTHTITGTQQQPGIIFLAMQELFERIEEQGTEKVTDLSLSYLEIYNETIRDLLVPGKANLSLREDAKHAVSVAGLSTHHPKSIEQVMEMIMKGNQCRTMSPTDANATSSRSHAVLQINVSQRDRNAPVQENHTMATLSIIDLAGSERASATKNRGERLFEGANINKSLLALGSCINALCDPRKHAHIPYRNSKLTRLLKFSLGGNCQTVMIVCVSPSSQHFDETQNTLRYANRAKNIQTKVTRNVYNVDRHVKDFLVKIDEQRALIDELKAQQKQAEKFMFAKFKKQTERKTSVLSESLARLRHAHENTATERQDKISYMIRLKQVQRRLSILSSWLAAFDAINARSAEDGDDALGTLELVRKTAQKLLHDLTVTEKHCLAKISASNWERAINSALETGLKQLHECELVDALDTTLLTTEASHLKSAGERDILTAVREQDDDSSAGITEGLLRSNFETISVAHTVGERADEHSDSASKETLAGLLSSCANLASSIVQPDGKLVPISDLLHSPRKSPRRSPRKLPKHPSPKRRKSRLSGIPMLPNLASTASPAVPRLLNGSRVIVSPLKPAPSPRKRHMPVKKTRTSAVRKLDFEQTDSEREQRAGKKAKKRGVRWKDDIEEGKLVEFQQTPEKRTTPRLMPERSTPMKPVSAQNTVGAAPRSPSLPPLVEEDSSLLSPAPQASELPDTDTSFDRSISLPSAIPKRRSSSSSTESSTPLSAGAPSASQGGNSRGHTRAGYLSKRSFAGSLLSTPLSRQSLSAGSAGANKPPPLQGIGNIASLQRRISSSAFSQSSLDSIDEDSGLQVIKNEAKTINSALRRVSSAGASLLPQANRRRSSASAPTPPDENGGMFTLSQARRMVKGEKPSELKTSVLSPRSASITKGSKEHARARRSTTFADLRSMREAAASRSQETPLRLAPTGLPGSAAGRRRVSLAYPITARSMLR